LSAGTHLFFADLELAQGARFWKSAGIDSNYPSHFFFAVPAPLRDRVYLLLTRNRYRWFGQRDACPVPAAGARARFL